MGARALAALLSAAVAAAATPPARAHNVEWLSLTPFDGKTFTDAMPAGNGVVQVLAWGNASAGGLSFYVRSPLAQHTDSALFTIARVDVAVAPSPFVAGAYVNQTLNLEDGSITLLAGGTSFADHAVSMSLYVDANSPNVLVAVASAAPVALSVSLVSVRPAALHTYKNDFYCNASTTRPDVFITPAGGVGLYHDNNVSLGDPAFFAGTMVQQGLAPLLSTFSDPLDGRVWGVGLAGGAGADGAGAPLVRGGAPGALASAAPATAFLVRATVRADAGARGDTAGWARALEADMAAGPAPAARAAASRAWWDAFWARSWIETPAPPAPGGADRVGFFACAAPGNASQAVALGAGGSLALADGRCFVLEGGAVAVAAGAACAGAPAWVLLPCTAAGCGAGDVWVVAAGDNGTAWDMPGANCPWVSTYGREVPIGSQHNQLFTFDAATATLRTRCFACAGACLTAVPGPPSSPTNVADQYARARFVYAIQARGTSVPIKFNGMAFTAQAGTNGVSDVDYRQWG